MPKPKKKRSQVVQAERSAGSRASSPGLSKKKRLAFALSAALVLPLVFLLLLEIGLRIGGYGYPTTFFLERNEGNETFLVENSKFGWRFFPKEVARSPSVAKFKKEKAPGAIRIILFGESAALGDPRPGSGMGRYLEMLLKERYPQIEFEVIVAAMTAVNSHAILPIARECRKLKADHWIIYMGNNEMAGPFGANPIFGKPAPGLRTIRAGLAVKATKTGQLLESFIGRMRGPQSKQAWEGIKMFVEHQLPPTDERKQTVYRNFAANLEEMVNLGMQSGAKVIVSTVLGNLKDFPPFFSMSGNLTPQAKEEWSKLMDLARQHQSSNAWTAAETSLAQALKLDPFYAETHFRLGAAALAQTNLPVARISYQKARDYDTLPFRTDSKQNEIIREVASRNSSLGVRLIDPEETFTQEGAIPGEETFFDHVHFKFEGNYRLALLLAVDLENQFPTDMKSKASSEWASRERIEQRLGLTDWNRRSAYEEMLGRVFDAPFTNQFNYMNRGQRMVQKIRELRESMHPRIYFDTRAAYEDELAKAPGDFRLRENFAEFLEAIGDLPEATEQWKKISEILAHHHLGYFQAGRLLARQKKYEEARGNLNRALAVRPDLIEARLELGQIFHREKKYDEAMTQYQIARKQRPTEAKVLMQIADLQAAQNQRAEALKNLYKAVELRSDYWEARYLIGVELAAQERFPEAIDQFREVLKIRPDHASAHFNLGVALAKKGEISDAYSEFQQTLRYDPEHKAAKQYANELGKIIQKATEQVKASQAK